MVRWVASVWTQWQLLVGSVEYHELVRRMQVRAFGSSPYTIPLPCPALQLAAPQTMMLRECMLANRDYYAPLLEEEEAMMAERELEEAEAAKAADEAAAAKAAAEAAADAAAAGQDAKTS